MAKVYLQVEFKTGNLFEYSKEEKQGFEEHKNSKGNTSYRRYHKDGAYGVYKGTTIRDTDFGKEISVHLFNDMNDDVFINFPLYDQSKNIAAYAESFISVLPAMEQGYVYRIFPYSMEKENSNYKTYGISVKHADMTNKTVREDYPLARLTYTYTKKTGEKIEGDIPAIDWKENFDGSKVKDCFERNKYLYSILVNNSQESTKTSNKVTGGEPPKPFTNTTTTNTPVENTEPQKIIAYEQEPLPAQVAEEPKKAPSKSVDLPF